MATRFCGISADEGADTIVDLALSEDVEGVSGKCIYQRKEFQTQAISRDPAEQTSVLDWTDAHLSSKLPLA